MLWKKLSQENLLISAIARAVILLLWVVIRSLSSSIISQLFHYVSDILESAQIT